MDNEMLQNIEKVLRDTDKIKTVLKSKGIDPAIQVEGIFENFNTYFKIHVVINY